MTDSLIQKLEEKVLTLITELENARKEIHHLKQENSIYKSERQVHTKKLQNIIALLDAMDTNDNSVRELDFSDGQEESKIIYA